MIKNAIKIGLFDISAKMEKMLYGKYSCFEKLGVLGITDFNEDSNSDIFDIIEVHYNYDDNTITEVKYIKCREYDNVYAIGMGMINIIKECLQVDSVKVYYLTKSNYDNIEQVFIQEL